VTLGEIEQLRHQLSVARQRMEQAFGDCMVLLSQLERAAPAKDSERGRVDRLERAERSTLGEEAEGS
jgi:hypothetical protein